MNEYFKRNKQIVMRQIGGETLLIPINQTNVDVQKIYVLNETAASVWQKIESPQTIKRLVESLHSEFEGEPEEIEAHLIDLINDLDELGFILKEGI